jgi:hypothetical protein
MTEYTQETVKINGVDVTVYGGTKQPVLTYALPGHVTGWSKRNGARTTYAELTCTCRLTGEKWAVEDGHDNTWISYGEEGWVDRLNTRALAHIENITANGFMIRPAGGDRSRHADRRRVNLHDLRDEMQRAGLHYSELQAHLEDIVAGHHVTAEDGTRFEIASDRSPYTREPLPIELYLDDDFDANEASRVDEEMYGPNLR